MTFLCKKFSSLNLSCIKSLNCTIFFVQWNFYLHKQEKRIMGRNTQCNVFLLCSISINTERKWLQTVSRFWYFFIQSMKKKRFLSTGMKLCNWRPSVKRRRRGGVVKDKRRNNPIYPTNLRWVQFTTASALNCTVHCSSAIKECKLRMGKCCMEKMSV